MNFEEYTQLCSEKTLQSNKEGFFLQFAEAAAENVGKKWINNFGKLKTDKERIRKIYEDDKIKQNVTHFLINVEEVYRKKSADMSKTILIEAEAAQKSGDKKKALKLYSQSILKAPKAGVTLSLALLGRAKLLITLNEYSIALTDVQFALKEKIADNLKFEAFWMMAVCYKALGNENKSKISLNLAEKLIGDNNKLLGVLHDSLKVKYEPVKKIEKKIPPITGDSHDRFSCASKKIKIDGSQEMGRFAVAKEIIKTGETLVVEPAAVACLYPEKFGIHCHHCFERFLAPVGCPDCVGVAFCSLTCRDAAISSYHKYECKFLDLLIGSGMSVLSLAALRSVTQRHFKEISKDSKQDNFFGLCSISDKRPNEDFFQRTLMAAFLLRCLQKSKYFGNVSDTVVPTEEEYRIGEMLLRNLQILQFNAHEISETLYSAEQKFKGGRLSYIGVALYPTVALFNHDCYPAVARHFVGKQIVITSTRPLTPGTVIAENYGPIFTHRRLIDRQRSLSGRYWFNCKCDACVEDWPMLNNGSAFIKRVRCTTVDCPYLFTLPVAEELQCPRCEKIVKLEEHVEKLKWCEEQYEIGRKFLETNKTERAVRILCEALDVFHRISTPPDKETHLAEEALRACLAAQGNVTII